MFAGDITIVDLVACGLVQPGDEWHHVTHRGKKKGVVRATVTESGGLRLENGKGFDNPSRAARTLCGAPINGWRFWRYEKDGEWVYIDELRQQARQIRGSEP